MVIIQSWGIFRRFVCSAIIKWLAKVYLIVEKQHWGGRSDIHVSLLGSLGSPWTRFDALLLLRYPENELKPYSIRKLLA